MDEYIKSVHKKLKLLEVQLCAIELDSKIKSTHKVKNNKSIKNIEKNVEKITAAFEKLYTEKEVERALKQNLPNDKIEVCGPENLPKTFDPKKTTIVRKGQKWRYHTLNAWLERKLELKGQWRIKNLGHKVMYKQVEFSKIEYKHFILSRKSTWDQENIWIWDDISAVNSADPKIKLIDYGNHQKRHGRRVVICDDCLYIDGVKYVWDSKLNRVVVCKEDGVEYDNNSKTRCE